jgi:2-dehydro-3-deoxygluconokinase
MASDRIVCFGELLLRLSAPGRELLMQSGRFDVQVGGAEANVAIALACLDHDSAMLSVVADNALGRGAIAALRAQGVDCSRVARADGRMGLYFLSPGAGVRASDIVYDRAGSAFATARAQDFDWPALLDGATRLHLSGITPALGANTAQAALDAADAARAMGVAVSFDGNYRARLWETWDSDPRAILHQLVERADLLFGNHRDISLLLGRDFSGEGEDRRREAAEAAFAAFPALDRIASTARWRCRGRIGCRETPTRLVREAPASVRRVRWYRASSIASAAATPSPRASCTGCIRGWTTPRRSRRGWRSPA